MNTNFKQSSAYELADKLQMDKAKALVYVDTVVQSAEMLRQQADRIAELEKEVEECWCGGHSYAYLKAKNRLPQTKTENIWTSCSDCGQKVTEDLIHTCSPQTKPLSDEEIRKIAIQCDAYDNDGSLITDDICIDKFARAIEERHGIK